MKPQSSLEEGSQKTRFKTEEAYMAKITNETDTGERPLGPGTIAEREAIDQPMKETLGDVPREECSTPLPEQNNNRPKHWGHRY